MNDHNTILIVDDDERIVRMFKRRLKKLGYDIHVAVNGVQGYDLAMSIQPDMVLTDIQMPIMDGYEMVRKLRKNGYDKLIVACTASVRAQDTESTFEAGCDFFIAKPVGLSFEDTIENLLKT